MIVNIVTKYLIELLLGLVFTLNITAYKLLWERQKNLMNETEKNSESINMIVNRIFGLEKDSTDMGHIEETEERFDSINRKLDELAEGQNKAMKERQKEHREVSSAINYIVSELSDEEGIDFDGEKIET